MEAINNAILDPVEEIFDSVGLMQGEMAPLLRAGVGAGLGWALTYGLQPQFMFKDGKPRPWAVTAKVEDVKDSTYFPAWLGISLPAFVFGALV